MEDYESEDDFLFDAVFENDEEVLEARRIECEAEVAFDEIADSAEVSAAIAAHSNVAALFAAERAAWNAEVRDAGVWCRANEALQIGIAAVLPAYASALAEWKQAEDAVQAAISEAMDFENRDWEDDPNAYIEKYGCYPPGWADGYYD